VGILDIYYDLLASCIVEFFYDAVVFWDCYLGEVGEVFGLSLQNPVSVYNRPYRGSVGGPGYFLKRKADKNYNTNIFNK
jgi:hypothetical protein